MYCNHIIIGRSDKRFCQDRCRNAYYYLNNTVVNPNPILKVNRILKKNRDLLNQLMAKSTNKVPLSKLNESGFDFNYLTRIETHQAQTVYFCYDVGYSIINDQEALLVSEETTSL